MPRLLPGLRLLVVLVPLALTACADSSTLSSPPSASVLQRDYDKTLTKDEQKAVISDMQAATAKRPDPAAGSY